MIVAGGFSASLPATAQTDQDQITFELSDRSMTCTLTGFQAPYEAETDCSLKSPGFGFDYPRPKCDPGSPLGVQILAGDAGASQAKYVCTDSGGDGPLARPGAFFVNDPFECRVIDDGHGSGVNCRNLYYGSGFQLQHDSYQLHLHAVWEPDGAHERLESGAEIMVLPAPSVTTNSCEEECSGDLRPWSNSAGSPRPKSFLLPSSARQRLQRI